MMTLFGKRTLIGDAASEFDLILNINPPVCEKFIDSEDKIPQLQTTRETYYSSVIKQSLNGSLFDPSFSEHTSKINEFPLPPETPLRI